MRSISGSRANATGVGREESARIHNLVCIDDTPIKGEHLKDKLTIERVCTTAVQSQKTARGKQGCYHPKSGNPISESQI
jgi:hypothetical protein